MLENKTIPPIAVVETTSSIVFDTGWVRAKGTGATIDSLGYTNGTGRMLMWTFESVASQNSVSSSRLYPFIQDGAGNVNQASTNAFAFRRASGTSEGVEERVYQGTIGNLGEYRFHHIGNSGGNPMKYMMLPADCSIYLRKMSSMNTNDWIDYKIKVIEENVSLLSIYAEH
jgi:hypothetical protein